MVNGITIFLKSKKYYLYRYKHILITQNVQVVLKKYTLCDQNILIIS